MKTVVLYSTENGKTRKLVKEFVATVDFVVDVFCVEDVTSYRDILDYDTYILFSPNYGDRELPQTMEDFLVRFDCRLDGKYFVVCELGNYGGYDEFFWGASKTMREHMLSAGADELCDHLTLESHPKLNKALFQRWISYINTKVAEFV